jgi:hypothetical protein
MPTATAGPRGAFSTNFYKTHQKRDAHSLEGVINALHAEVTQHGVPQIRELIIVAHANGQRAAQDPLRQRADAGAAA